MTGVPILAPGPIRYRMGDREFRLLRGIVEGEVGIQLPESKRPLLVARLARRLRELGLSDFAEYHRRLSRSDGEAERMRMFDLVSTNETHFFRDPRQFSFLAERVAPAWVDQAARGCRARRLRAWSAGCATGEEPYSVAMSLLAGRPGWGIEVLGSDLSTRALDKARSAVWPLTKARDIPDDYLEAFMLRGTGDQQGRMKASPELRAVVGFERINLHAREWAVGGRFDLILCRNVLIYFSAAGRAAVARRLLDHLAPGGMLLLGHAETLSGVGDRVRIVGPGAYACWQALPPHGARVVFRPTTERDTARVAVAPRHRKETAPPASLGIPS